MIKRTLEQRIARLEKLLNGKVKKSYKFESKDDIAFEDPDYLDYDDDFIYYDEDDEDWGDDDDFDEDDMDEKKIDPFQLTKQQADVVKALEKKVVCDVDNKTLVISISVTDQDPLICATVADSVQARLQEFITNYRTKKARVDVEYNQKLSAEAKAQYDKAREQYAEYADAHQDIMYQSDRTKLMNLENDMQLKYNAYNALAQQLLAAEAKVQEETPSFTTLQRATVPVIKAGPSRGKLVLIVLFLAFLCTSVWILYKEDQLKPLLGLS
jgi:uncharacterized protein involved in exopolysaccharide biosynthesis